MMTELSVKKVRNVMREKYFEFDTRWGLFKVLYSLETVLEQQTHVYEELCASTVNRC